MDTELAPTGKFRVGMNGNNATLYDPQRRGTPGGFQSISAAISRASSACRFEPVPYALSTPYTASFGSNEWEIIITGKNAVVVKRVDFSSDLFRIQDGYIAAP